MTNSLFSVIFFEEFPITSNELMGLKMKSDVSKDMRYEIDEVIGLQTMEREDFRGIALKYENIREHLMSNLETDKSLLGDSMYGIVKHTPVEQLLRRGIEEMEFLLDEGAITKPEVHTDKGFLKELADLININEIDSLLGINAEQLATLMYQPIRPLVEEAAGE